MKHMITELETPNEPIMLINTILGNYYFDTFFIDFPTEESSVLDNAISKLMFYNHELALGDEERTSVAPEMEKK